MEFGNKYVKYILLAVVVVTIAVCVVVFYVHKVFYGDCVVKEDVIYVYDTTSYSELKDSIASHILHTMAFDMYARHINLENGFKHGRYEIRSGMSVMDIARCLKLGEQAPVRIVLGEARSIEHIAGVLARQVEADSMSIAKAMYDETLRGELGFGKDSLLAMFIPNTYEVYWTISPNGLIRRLGREYEKFWRGNRDAKLTDSGLSRYEVMTLASIVYEETKVKDEMPKISGVYINRLHRGIPLQACPTVKFAMGRFDLHRILNEYLRFDSPYNTYIHRGLPPGPIAVPSIAAIDAVLDYEKSDFLYFCARPEFDGKHNFARTLREHNENSRKYSAELSRRNIKY